MQGSVEISQAEDLEVGGRPRAVVVLGRDRHADGELGAPVEPDELLGGEPASTLVLRAFGSSLGDSVAAEGYQ